jgi:hypothetical protein
MIWGNEIRGLAGGLLILFMAAGPAAAQDTAVRFGWASGEAESQAFDLYLQHTLDAWLDRPGYSLSPYLNLGLTVWQGDKKEDVRVDQVWGLAAALGLRLESKTWETAHPYFAFNAGPSYISEGEFMNHDMGGNFSFNLRAGFGLRFGEEFRHNLGLDASHYSNAYTQSANWGYNALGFSYGYSFW